MTRPVRLALALLLAAATPVFSGEAHDHKGKHGGKVVHSGHHNLEIVVATAPGVTIPTHRCPYRQVTEDSLAVLRAEIERSLERFLGEQFELNGWSHLGPVSVTLRFEGIDSARSEVRACPLPEQRTQERRRELC